MAGARLDLLDHREADLRGQGPPGAGDRRLARLVAFRARSRASCRSPHRLADLAVDGTDLIGLGYGPARRSARRCERLLAEVVEDPEPEPRERLLARAEELSRAVIAWEAPGPYRVAFTTREGGVSDGGFASLNLGGSGDELARVAREPAHRLWRARARPRAAVVNRQRHTRDRAPGAGRRAGARSATRLWTDEPGLPLLALGADCVPIAIVAARRAAGARGRPRRLARARRRGRRARRARALGAAQQAAVIGPAIGPCCYEVGEEVSALLRPDLTRDGKLDLWAGLRTGASPAGVDRVERVELCTRCHPELFFSHRRTARRTARRESSVLSALRSASATGARAGGGRARA